MKMSVRPELTTAPPARVRDMRHTDGAVDNSALLPNHPGSTYKSGNAVQTAGATSPSSCLSVLLRLSPQILKFLHLTPKENKKWLMELFTFIQTVLKLNMMLKLQ